MTIDDKKTTNRQIVRPRRKKSFIPARVIPSMRSPTEPSTSSLQ